MLGVIPLWCKLERVKARISFFNINRLIKKYEKPFVFRAKQLIKDINMKILQKKGVYICVNDFKKDGYYTKDINGDLKNIKYGFLDKLNDIIKHGRTHDILYNFIFFYEDFQSDKILLETGSTLDELSKLLTNFKKNYGFSQRNNLKEYTILNEHEVEYIQNDKINKISFKPFENSLIHYYYDYFKKDFNQEIFYFYSFE